MQFPESFVPTAREVGLLPMVTELFLTAAAFAFLGGFIFFLTARNSVAPRLRVTNTLSAIICLVSCLAYWFLRHYYHELLHQVFFEHDPASRRQLFRDAFFAINQYRYMAWMVTIPLLVIHPILALKAQPREIKKPLRNLLEYAVAVVLLVNISTQLFVSDGMRRLPQIVTVATPVAFAFFRAVHLLYVHHRQNRSGEIEDDTGRTFRTLNIAAIVALFSVLIGYIPFFFRTSDLNWLHLVYTAVDLATQLGSALLVYTLGTRELEALVPPESVQKARLVG